MTIISLTNVSLPKHLLTTAVYCLKNAVSYRHRHASNPVNLQGFSPLTFSDIQSVSKHADFSKASVSWFV